MKHSGTVGVVHRPDLSHLTDEELEALDRLLAKATPDPTDGTDAANG